MAATWDETLEQHRDDQRAAIFAATLELVGEHGLAQVGMAEVARRTGVSRATLYKYFGGVEEILAAYVVNEVTRERVRLTNEIEDHARAIDKLQSAVEHMMGHFATSRHRSATGLFNPYQFAPSVAAEVGRAFGELFDMIEQLVGEAVDEGSLRGDVPVVVLAEMLRHLLSAGRALVVSDRVSASDASAAVLRQFVEGAGHR